MGRYVILERNSSCTCCMKVNIDLMRKKISDNRIVSTGEKEKKEKKKEELLISRKACFIYITAKLF